MPTAAATAAPDSARLLTELVAAGVLADGEAGELGRRFAAPDALADHLAENGRLTAFQAERAVLGGGFTVGPYRLEEPLGGGTLGTTYRATRTADGVPFAVRVLPPRSAWRLMHARKHLAAFAALPPHPAVVPFADADAADGRHYLAWGWADGTPLERAVLRDGPLPPGEAAGVFAELADGVRVCHAAGLLHGMLRPRSLLLGPDRRPRLLDLGLGGMLADNVGDERSLFDTLALANGTAALADWSAPEVLLDPSAGSPASDSYSFGCCLYFALTGRPPFPGDKLSDKVVGHLSREPVPVRALAPAVPAPLAAVLERLMRKEADERPTDFAALRDELQGVALAVAALTPPPADADAPPDAGEWSGPSGSAAQSVLFSPTGEVTLPTAVRALGRDDIGRIDFDAVPAFGLTRPDEYQDSGSLPPPLPPPPARRSLPPAGPPAVPLPPLTKSGRLLNPPRPVLPAADAGTRPARPPVLVPAAPAFDFAPLKAVRSVLFRKAADTVQLTVFGPPAVAAGGKARVLVYAHLPDAFGGVATLCRALHPDAELLGSGFLQKPIPRESVVGLFVSSPAAGVAKPLVELIWTGQTQPKSFDLLVPWEHSPGVADATLAAGWKEQRVAEVRFQWVVTPRG